ncbi:MAG: GNAT family N-acetyltransferase [Deltaproteobacteria bacterium]|nr:MAG: GNAT family N-acetyltransferase [Deltaproteobacteria bacterium]
MTEQDDPRILLRPLTLDDYQALRDLQVACFPQMEPWSEDDLRAQLRNWDRSQLGLFLDGQLVASCGQVIVDYADYDDWADYDELSASGTLDNHDPEGDTLYGIEMQVHPECRGMKLARRLYDARKTLCRDLNLARILIGGRIPGYGAVKDEMSPGEYVEEVAAKRIFDQVLTSQLANGFVLREIVASYLPEDEASAGYATTLEWANLDRVSPKAQRRKRRATQPIRVAFVQYKMRRITEWEQFEQQVRFFVATASDSRADFLLFPELFTLQLLSLVDQSRPGLAARQLAEFTPRYVELFRSLAVRFDIHIIAGSQFTVEEDEELYNVAYLFRRDGTVATQKKLHVTPSEARWWGVRGGDELRYFETDKGRIGILVCYDVEFPEAVRRLAHDHVRLLFVPYNTNDKLGHHRVRACAQARCIENHMFVVTAGCVGNLPSVENADTHYAASAVLTPSDYAFARDGIAAEAEPNVETVVVQDLDLETLRRHRRRGTVQNYNDRRTDLYRVAWRSKDGQVEI